jgi:hypothetical protein
MKIPSRTILQLSLLTAAIAYGADAPKPPTLPDSIKAQFFKAQTQLIQANAAVQEKQQAFTHIIDVLRKQCGDGFTLGMSKDGDPECQAGEVKTPSPAKQ